MIRAYYKLFNSSKYELGTLILVDDGLMLVDYNGEQVMGEDVERLIDNDGIWII